MTDEDIRNVADHIAHNIRNIAERYATFESALDFDDYVLVTVATDLSYKYSRYQVQEAFEDYRIKILLEFYLTDEDYKEYNEIH